MPLGEEQRWINSSLMAATERSEAWIAEPTRDCSVGFCSIYCHHWCYLLFPPPPPALIISPEATSRSPFSPLAIAIIGVLVTAFLLVSYYAIASKYCGAFASLRRHHHPSGSINREPNREREAWHVVASPRRGLDQAAIDSIARWRYKKADGLVEGGDCSICLGEFREDESLRLLPKCGHAFHLRCVDTWLKSHSNCPLCRAPVTAANGPRGEDNGQNVQVREEENPIENIAVEAIPQTHGGSEGTESDAAVEMMESNLRTLRRCASMGSLRHGREVNMEELVAAANGGILIGSSSSTVSRVELAKSGNSSNFDGSLQCCARSPPLVRSFSSGRLGFRRNGRVRNTILPL